jgi:hypothetical protein
MNAIEPFVLLGGCVIGATAPRPIANKTIVEETKKIEEKPEEVNAGK